MRQDKTDTQENGNESEKIKWNRAALDIKSGFELGNKKTFVKNYFNCPNKKEFQNHQSWHCDLWFSGVIIC